MPGRLRTGMNGKMSGRVVVDAYSRSFVSLKVVESLGIKVVLDHRHALFGQYGKFDE
ncbi:MAG: hypothetical protein GY801_12075 [bacterium]|nr:hypothetical protein [bacterium]